MFIIVLVSVVFVVRKTGAGSGRVFNRSAVVSLLVGLRMFRSVLGGLFGLATFHFGLFQKPLLFRQSLALFAVFHFILSNESLRWTPKDTLVFAEFTNPNVLQAWGMMQVCVLLLDLALPCGHRIDAGR